MTEILASSSLHLPACLETHIAAARSIASQYQDRQYQQQEHRTRRHEQQALAVLRALLETELEADVRESLQLTYQLRPRQRASFPMQVEAVFSALGFTWHLTHEQPWRQGEWHWEIALTASENQRWHRLLHDFPLHTTPLTLQQTLLEAVDQCRRRLEQEAREAAEREAALRQEQEQEARERAARLEQAAREDAHWRAEFARRRQELQAALWRWPQDVCVSIYRVRYLTTVGHDENGAVVTEHEEGWCRQDHLSQDGYLCLESTRSGRSLKKSRYLKLDPAYHLPIWERRDIASIEDLPLSLCEPVIISFPGVVERSDEQGVPRLRQLDEPDVDADLFSEYQEDLGRVPLPWIRALAEEQAAANQKDRAEAEAR